MNNPRFSALPNPSKRPLNIQFQADNTTEASMAMAQKVSEVKNMELENILLNIDQVSRLTGVKKCTIRYWEKSFNQFLKPVRTESKRREYTMHDIAKVNLIKKLVEEEHLTNMGVMLRLSQIFKGV
jgi:predicted DNA-binding transcriptional regulator AlpA